MPPPRSRQTEDKDASARSKEQEIKRAKGAISCAECRRLKLKCDKTIPCASCTRRGCATICPNGSLTTGQGTRFVLADTERLHTKIDVMSKRIRQLEDGLSLLQSSVSREEHPLLRKELLDVKSSIDLHAARSGGLKEAQEDETEYIDAFGTLAVRDDGAATFFGRSAGSESLLVGEQLETEVSALPYSGSSESLHPTIDHLTNSFPFQSSPSDFPVTHILEIIRDYLPPWPRAAQLCDLYLEQAPWFFGAVTRRQLLGEILPLYYPESDQVSKQQRALTEPSQSGSSNLSGSVDVFQLSGAKKQESTSSSHDLALMFVVFCFGALTDPALPAAPHNAEADRYYKLTRAALALEPVLDRPPGVATVQTLSLMAIYQGLVADENSIESTWALMGLSSRLAQSVGLHRDPARFHLKPHEVQKRRALFWELFITDCFQSLATGRLATFSLPFVDTELPSDPDQTIADDGSTQPSFPAWKARFGKEVISAIVDGTTRSGAPKYSVILDLDRKIRDMDLPKCAKDPVPMSATLSGAMKHYMPINYRELSLLYVHRCYFAQALSDFPLDPQRSTFAPSFLAGYRSSSTLLTALREQFQLFPIEISRFWVLWTHAFSAATMLGSVVIRSSTTKIAQAAMGEFTAAVNLFGEAERLGGRATQFAPRLRRLYAKAQNAFANGVPRKDIFTPRGPQDEEHDELSIFSGRTRMVATKASKTALSRTRSMSRMRKSSSNCSSNAASPPDSTPASSESPASDATAPSSYHHTLESYGSEMHPGLVAQIQTFEGQLDAQINTSYPPVISPSHSSHSNVGSDPGGYQVQYQPPLAAAYPVYDSPPQNDWQASAPQHSSENLPQQQIPHIQHTMATPRHQTMQLPPELHMAHALPMFGGVDAGPMHPHDASYYHPYGVAVPQDDTQYSQVPPQPVQSWSAPPSEQPLAYPSHSPYEQHPPDDTFVASRQPQAHHQEYSYHPQAQAQNIAPPPSVLPVHSGEHSLQDSWISFVQGIQTQQVPAHSGHRPSGYEHPSHA